jgi:thiamine biosynthesis protein ThiS
MSDVAREALEIQVNGEPRRLDRTSTLAALLAELGVAERRIAVAVNREVVPRSRFASHALRDGDRVEILQAVGGGA